MKTIFCVLIALSSIDHALAQKVTPAQVTECMGLNDVVKMQLADAEAIYAKSPEALKILELESAEILRKQEASYTQVAREAFSDADLEYLVKLCNSPTGKRLKEFRIRLAKEGAKQPLPAFFQKLNAAAQSVKRK